MINHARIHNLTQNSYKKGGILYWMSRDQRLSDNWALIHSQELAEKFQTRFEVAFCLVPDFLQAGLRQYDFMLKGLKELEKNLRQKNIAFHLLFGDPVQTLPAFIRKKNIGFLVTDFDPLRVKKRWKNKIKKSLPIPFQEVDAHNIVPVWEASGKKEYAAYTIRPKIEKLLPVFLDRFSRIKTQKSNMREKPTDWDNVYQELRLDHLVKPVSWIRPGEAAAKKTLQNFIKNKLAKYDETRNDPNQDAQSNLSPYLHFGQISAQRIALEIIKSNSSSKQKQAFLEELIMRKELSDNFCHYEPDYDKIKAAPAWARQTLRLHQSDKRQYLYSRKELELGKTHDKLWNAAQLQMAKSGKMHGYLRMYWAKKILEWSEAPQKALKQAIYLNDKYELDGRDPNGYAGIAWSLLGVHDRAWPERKILGKIRYMSFEGCKRKFNVEKYIKKYL